MAKELNKGIGAKPKKLTAKPVLVVDVLIADQKDAQGVSIGDKVVLVCNHPDSNKAVEISQAKIEKNTKVKVQGLWYSLDDEGNLSYGSTTAILLRHYNCETLQDLIGKTLETTSTEDEYIVIKAY